MRGSVPLPPVPAGRRLWQRRILKKGSCRGIWHALGCRLAGQLGWLGWAGHAYLFLSPSAPSAARSVPSSLGAWVPTTIDLE